MNSVKCNLCGHDKTKLIQKADAPFCVVQCINCGLVYTRPLPDIRFLENHYNEGYYSDWIQKQFKNRRRMWKKRLNELKQFKKSGRLLDVGCGLTTFLKLAKEDGFQVHGTEVSEFIAAQTNPGSPMDVFQGELEAAQFPSERFDVITLWHSLEHMPDPKRSIREVHRILKTDGLLVIAVPNLNNYIMRFFYYLAKRKKFQFFTPGGKELHLYHFSTQTLRKLLEETGFEIIKEKMDLSAVVFQRKIIDFLSAIAFFFTRRNFADGLKVYARKISNH